MQLCKDLRVGSLEQWCCMEDTRYLQGKEEAMKCSGVGREGGGSSLRPVQVSDMQCLHTRDSEVQLFWEDGGLVLCELTLSCRGGGRS